MTGISGPGVTMTGDDRYTPVLMEKAQSEQARQMAATYFKS